MRNKLIFIVVPVILIVIVTVLLLFGGIFKEQAELKRFPIKYSEIVEAAADRHGVPSEMVYAVIYTESNFREDAVSRVGAKGLMQLIDETNEWIAFVRGEEVMAERLFEPEFNIDRGTWLLSYLHEKYGTWREALAAYNAGIGRVNSWLSDPTISSDGVILDYIPFDETSAYVTKVMNAAEKYRELYFVFE